MSEHTTALAVALLLIVALSPLANVGTAATEASIEPDPADPGATSTHTTMVTNEQDTISWGGYDVDYDVDGNFDGTVSNVGQDDIDKIGIDRGESFSRPFLRRRLMIFRPSLVFIRSRKPCFFLRFFWLGW